MDSPALSVMSDVPDFTDEELDKYFASYVPLSNLPTPPPAKQLPVGMSGSTPAAVVLPSEREAYSTHLANLVPANISAHRPCITTIQELLDRAGLPPEVIAFSACILDALSVRLATSWRASCPPSGSPTFKSKSTINWKQPQAVDPEVIVLSAVSLAHDFLSDVPRSNRHWAQVEGNFLFSANQVNATKMCILKDIDYGLARIKESRVQRMMRDMQHASSFSNASRAERKSIAAATEKDERRPKLSLNLQGTAMWRNGAHTPEPSP